jgi:Nucleoside-diphosphate-sugar epimerases
LLKEALKESGLDYIRDPIFRDFRSGDVLHSQASIKKAKNELSFNPSHNIKEGLAEAMPWYIKNS